MMLVERKACFQVANAYKQAKKCPKNAFLP